MDEILRQSNEVGQSVLARPDGAAADADRRQYMALLAEACSRDEDDLLLFHLAHHQGHDVYAQRFPNFDDLVQVERVRRDVSTPAENLSPAQRQELANDRATALLLENLSAQQRCQYKTYRYFDVTGGESGRWYRIWHRSQQNIEELDVYGRRICIWCFHPIDVALGNVLLAQKTALELFERDAMRIANRYSDFAPPRPD